MLLKYRRPPFWLSLQHTSPSQTQCHSSEILQQVQREASTTHQQLAAKVKKKKSTQSQSRHISTSFLDLGCWDYQSWSNVSWEVQTLRWPLLLVSWEGLDCTPRWAAGLPCWYVCGKPCEQAGQGTTMFTYMINTHNTCNVKPSGTIHRGSLLCGGFCGTGKVPRHATSRKRLKRP